MKNNQTGMTLIEVMLAMMLFTIAFTCSIVILNKGLEIITDTSNFLQAICIANQQMESAKSLRYDELKNHSFVINKFKGEVSIKNYEDGLKEVLVTTKWVGSVGLPKRISLVTLIAKKE
ncbi:MAG: prepilin-type N-terminal cleavage/methylation domain-containing protein [bacterium]|nr:prepilin-type N-terminal cleavage/methylation domain-containing protein [bacterium]